MACSMEKKEQAELRPPKVSYSLVHELADDGVPVAVACRVLKVSTSRYYDWLGRPESPRQLRNKDLRKMTEVITNSPARQLWITARARRIDAGAG